jgi:hypothetical protein
MLESPRVLQHVCDTILSHNAAVPCHKRSSRFVHDLIRHLHTGWRHYRNEVKSYSCPRRHAEKKITGETKHGHAAANPSVTAGRARRFAAVGCVRFFFIWAFLTKLRNKLVQNLFSSSFFFSHSIVSLMRLDSILRWHRVSYQSDCSHHTFRYPK